MSEIEFSDFEKVDIRLGKIINVELLEGGKYSTHKIVIDFGEEIGHKKSTARLVNYSTEELLGKNVIAVLNFPPRQIGKSVSEVLTLGIPDSEGECVLLSPDKNAELGSKLF